MSHRILDRYNLLSIIKVGLGTTLLATLMLIGVDLFSNIYTYMNQGIGLGRAFYISFLYFPEAFLLAMGPSFMFAATYHLSMLHSSNEIMCVLNSGTSLTRVITPCIILAVALSAFHFAFNEFVAIPMSNQKRSISASLTGADTSGRNNQDVALSDMQQHYMVYAGRYSDTNQSLYQVSLVQSTEDGRFEKRTNAYKAVYNPDSGNWTFYDAYTYTPAPEGETGIRVEHFNEITNPVMTLEPQLFRNVSNEISTMSLDLAYRYMVRMKELNPAGYASIGTEFYERVLSCLTPLVMIFIACSMNYRFKKNVLFFSLICSICVAVVYYVVRMITIMLADQGVIAPILGVLIPFFTILVLSSLMGILLRRQ